MPGDATFTGGPLSLTTEPLPIGVFRLVGDPVGNPSGVQFQPLPNIRLVETRFREGAAPPTAVFRYVTQDDVPDQFKSPTWFYQILPLTANPRLVVSPNDRIVAVALTPNGTAYYLFDGYPVLPEGNIDGRTHSIPFQAIGTPVRVWDTPMPGAVWHDYDVQASAFAGFLQTDLPVHFNPDGYGNSSPSPGFDEDYKDPATNQDTGLPIPGFVDYRLKVPDSSVVMDRWSLGPTVRYLMTIGNFKEAIVHMGLIFGLDDLLKSYAPKAGLNTYNPLDNTTYDLLPITVPDTVFTGGFWPEQVAQLIEQFGFHFTWTLATDANLMPFWDVLIWRDNDGANVKDLYMQKVGSDLDPGKTNLASLQVARDCAKLVNSYTVSTAPTSYEVGFVLVPGFTITGTDSTSGNLKTFKTTNTDLSADMTKYRVWIFDEGNEGRWSFFTSTFGPATRGGGFIDDLKKYFGTNNPWTFKRRKPGSTLFSKDKDNNPIKASLFLLLDYGDINQAPEIWRRNAGGSVYPVDGSWSLLQDRIGIQITEADPNAFQIGPYTDVNDAAKRIHGGLLNQVELLASLDPAKFFCFLLVCTIDSDEAISVTADRRPASPVSFTVQRKVDARDRYQNRVIDVSSPYNQSGAVIKVDDFTDEATDYAKGLREANQSGLFSGSFMVPRITRTYSVGNKIRQIVGRPMDFGSRLAVEQGEQPGYPSIIEIIQHFDQGESTTCNLTDARATRPPAMARPEPVRHGP